MGYNVNLKVYEGPMELLLDLIRKNEIDIYDIPIHIITSEFLAYIAAVKELNMELTSDFLVMASTLLEIKSKMLLPKIKLDDEEIDEEDPREQLVQKILEYEKYKEVSEKLRESEKYELKAFYKLQEDFSNIDRLEFLNNCNVKNLHKALQNIIKRNKTASVTNIAPEEFPVQRANEIILEYLESKDKFLFSELLGEYSFKAEIIAYFLSLLEFIKIGRVSARQTGNYSDIEIIRRDDFGR
ncbi:segregation and condensation protein A [Peptoniphilus mikwangii]|uniref:segregation and condensation protein A n=1 Tax=Peptoniphilus mikwangii TaxID=1354300 RepID=UPI0003FD4EED|nr:segregation/condensation protein A [Peptoniphilus mikwangii]